MFKSHSLYSQFFPLYHEFCQQCKSPKKSTTTSYCTICKYVEHHLLILILILRFLLMPLVECLCMHMPHRLGRPSGMDHTNEGERRMNCKFHSITCYTNFIVSLIHVNTAKLRNITCTLVAIGVILRSLECRSPRRRKNEAFSMRRTLGTHVGAKP